MPKNKCYLSRQSIYFFQFFFCFEKNALARTQSINMYFAPCGGIFMTIYRPHEIHTKQKLRSVSFVNALMIYITRLSVYIIARAKI